MQYAQKLAPCVGREGELARLNELYRECSQTGERLALLVGPSGVGKSRILSEFRGRIRLEGGVVLEGRCEPGRAFGPFADIVDRALRFLDEVGRVPSIDLADLACQGSCHRFWYQHHGPLSIAVESMPGTTIGTDVVALEKRLRFFDALRGLLRDVASVRVPVVMLHDLERADRGTLQLLSFLLDGSGPFDDGSATELRALLLASVRPEASDGAAVAKLLEHRSARLIHIGELDADGVRAYLQSPDTVARILERTGGVPEAIDLLLDGDPLTPVSRIGRRLEDLSSEARSLVEALAVHAHPADLDVLGRVGRTNAVGSQVHRELELSELVTRSIVDGAIFFSFTRESDRERAVELISGECRSDLHARWMNEYARRPGKEENAARHALAAGEYQQAVPLAMEAARSLAASHAQGEAAALLEQVVQAASTISSFTPPLELFERLSDLLRAEGDYKRALVHAGTVREAAPTSAAATRRVGELLMLAGRLDEAADLLENARQLAQSALDPAAVIEVEALLGELHYQRASYEESRIWAEKAHAAASENDELVLALHAKNTLGKLALAQKDASTAAAIFEDNRQRAADSDLGHQEAQALTNLGVAMLRLQDLGAAESAFEQAIAVAQRVSDTRDRAIATENLAVLAHLRRDYGRAQEHYHEAVALLKRLGNRAMLARVAINLGELYLSLGARTRARTLCDFSSHMGGTGLPPSVTGEGLVLRGRIAAANGDTPTARAAFEAALRTYERLGEARVADTMIELAKVALADGDVARARAILADLPVQESPKKAAEVALVAVDVERAAGGDTLGSSRRALELAEHVDDHEILLPALVRLARALCDGGDLASATAMVERAQSVDEALTERVPTEALDAWSARPHRGELTAVQSLIASAWSTQSSVGSWSTQSSVGSWSSQSSVGLWSSQSANSPQSSRPPSAPPLGSSRVATPTARDQARWSKSYPNLVGQSAAMASVCGTLDKVAPTDALVLVRGESGTGKELIAEALHANSARCDKPLVKVNCAALVETLLMSELFGHERGAFTGANARKKGRFELADGGTLFLDEIGDISPKTQVALLRVLQEREFDRVGGTHPVKVDVRIIAATHRDLEAMVREGAFREDLYYRLRGVMIEMPPLRKHLGDLPALCDRLLARIGEERGEAAKIMSDEALSLLHTHHWPGNVRELENVLRSATLFADAPLLAPNDFAAFATIFDVEPEPETSLDTLRPARASTAGTPSAESGDVDFEGLVYDKVRGGETSLLELKKIIERECIVRALRETDGNITRAASLLGMKRPRLSQLAKQYGLSSDQGEA